MHNAQKDVKFLFEKRRGQPQEFWPLASTIDGSTIKPRASRLDGSTLPQDCVEELLCTGKTFNLNKTNIVRGFLTINPKSGCQSRY